MTDARLPTSLLVGALLRQVNDAGGLAVVRARGDAQAGGVLVLVDAAEGMVAVERGLGPDGRPGLIESQPGADAESYWRRRRARDPDLWVLELNIPSAKRLVAETLLSR